MCKNNDLVNVMNISAADFFERMVAYGDSPDVVILDIRTADEYEIYHIRGAVNIDFYAEDFSEELDALDRDKVYLIYCRTGRRTGTAEDNALELMKRMEFPEVYNMPGGIHAFVKVEGTEDYLV
jgi:rhodanese-related sulfurtransferase